MTQMKCKTIYNSKEEEGLRIKDVKNFNITLLEK